jgi:hypothetical protein
LAVVAGELAIMQQPAQAALVVLAVIVQLQVAVVQIMIIVTPVATAGMDLD